MAKGYRLTQTSFYKTFYSPKTSYLAELFKFGQILNTENQMVSLFLNNFRSGAAECNTKNSLVERICDKFLSGLNYPNMQEELIKPHSEVKAKLNDIVTIATY